MGKGGRRGEIVRGAAVVLAAGVAAAAAVWGTAWEWVGAVALWGLTWAIWGRSRPTVRAALGVGLLARALWAPVPVVLSDDGYRYVWDGLAVLDGVNPYATRPSDRPLAEDAPWLRAHMNSPDYHSVYPPVSQAAFLPAALVYRSVGDGEAGARAALWTLKGTFALVELLLLLWLARRLPTGAFGWYAAFPLLVVDGFGQPHTDVLAAAALAAALIAVAGAGRVAALGLAASVKLWPALHLAAPGVVRGPHRRSRTEGLVAVGLVSAALVALALPFAAPGALDGLRRSLDLYVHRFEFYGGPYEALKWTGRLLTGTDVSKTLGPALRVLFVLGAGLWLWQAHRRRWSFPATLLGLSVGFFATATTVHPWYLVPLAVLLAADDRRGADAPHWYALGGLSTGALMTYSFYRGADLTPFLWLGWGLGGLFLAGAIWQQQLPVLMRRRARAKVDALAAALPASMRGVRVLDLGCGEGYVGAVLAEQGALVVLSDVVDVRSVQLPFAEPDTNTGRLPLDDQSFDVVLMVYVLHHAEDPETLIREALRVGKQVVVLESVIETRLDRVVLGALDRAANALRGQWMSGQPVAFRRASEWASAIQKAGATRVVGTPVGRWPHRQVRISTGIEPLLQLETKLRK